MKKYLEYNLFKEFLAKNIDLLIVVSVHLNVFREIIYLISEMF